MHALWPLITMMSIRPAGAVVPPASWTASGDRSGSDFGRSVAGGGDVNGDGWPDVVVGAPSWSNPEAGEGALLVYHGGPAGPAATPTTTLESGVANTGLGRSVAFAGDVDGDGFDDVIGGSGPARVWLGSAGGLVAVAAWVGPSAAYVAAAGDVDQDGFDDLLVADPSANGPLGSDQGTVSLFLGSPTGPAPTPAWSVQGESTFELLGSGMASGDLDGDGWRDLVLGGEGSARAGVVRVYLGSPAGFAANADTVVVGPAYSLQGRSVAVADLDGDGFDDVVAGAPEYGSGPGGAVGALVSFLGSPAGLVPTPAQVSSCDRSVIPCGNERFGDPVVAAGDVNGDGFGDALVGVGNAEPSGAAVIYLGSGLGLSAAPLATLEPPAGDAWFGYAVAAAGDMDADGFDDLLVTATVHDGAVPDAGRVYLYQGRALPDGDLDQIVDLQDVCPTVPDPRQPDTDLDGVGDACDAPILAVRGTLSAGGVARLDARGLAPGETAWFAAAVGGGGAGPCPAALGGLCLGLGPVAVTLDSAVADAAGEASLVVRIPASLVPNGAYVVQAVVQRGAGGGASVASPVVLLDGTVLDWDADGLTDARELAWGTDPTLADTDADGRSDADDLPPGWSPLDPDSDGDGVLDGAEVCPTGDDLADADGDGAPDACDGCPTTSDPLHADGDRDGVGNACEAPAVDFDVQLAPSSGGLWAHFGQALAILDADGDGFADLVVGAPHAELPHYREGQAELYPGSPGGVAPAPTWSVPGGLRGLRLGSSAAPAGDVNADGFADLLLIAGGRSDPEVYEGEATVWLGSPTGLAGAPAWTLQSDVAASGDWLVATGAGDVDGDGFDDTLVGNWRAAAARGRASLHRGTPAGPEPVASWTLTGGPNDNLGLAASGLGDLDGDGLADVAIASWLGGVSVFLGSPTGLPAVGEPVVDTSDYLPLLAGGDTDGDGYDDLVVGLEGEHLVVSYSGSAWGIRGAAQAFDAGLRAFRITMMDADADGRDDLALGGIEQDGFEYHDGFADLWLGGPTGLETQPAWFASLGSGVQSGFGQALAAGDLDGDGFDDLAVGAPGFSASQGAVLLYAGHAR